MTFISSFISSILSKLTSRFKKATIVISLSTALVKLLTLNDKIIAIDTTIKVIIIQAIEAKEREKLRKTLLNESLIFRPKILNTLMDIFSFLIILNYSTRVK